MLIVAVINAIAIDYVVKGNIDGMDGKKIYIRDYDTEKVIDSTLVNDGSFIFKGYYERPAYVRIDANNKYTNLILDSLAVVDFDTHLPSSGSLLNMKLLQFIADDKKIEDELDQFGRELRAHGFEQPELGEIYKHLYDKLHPVQLQLYYNTIAENPNGLGEKASRQLGNIWGLTPDEWDKAYSQMSSYLKQRKLTNHFNDKFNNLRKSQPGNPYMDFKAKDLDGKDVMLSDYVGKGKYVLLDFWASWCGPCKEEAEKTLRPLYEKYKNDDRFMILGVATWDRHDKTITALEKLQYPWPQIIDTDEMPMELYGFDAIPQLILIGPEGTIIERDLREEKITAAVDNVLSTKKIK